LGYTFLQLKNYDEAIVSYRSAIRLQPDNASAHHYLGLSLLAAGRREEAMAEYRTLQQLDHEEAQKLLTAIKQER